ncbi:regulatory protein RecX [Sphingomonas sp.]|uniref:regulatory protein RecX n=1 Tax=Sphingomonas sp. TaxID=28214 RepID=UPI002DD66C10|nr:RecX family transcriptional regulator [Sphingomonas sp.]
MPRDRRPPTPLESAALERLALRYVERYATTRGRLRDYLNRKLRERGWAGEGEADVAALAERMAELHYIDDRGFAESRAAAMGRRGLGARRIALAMHAAGIAEEDRATLDDEAAEASALAFARRRRIGPFARVAMDRDAQARAFAAMLRAGHDIDRSRRILALTADDLDQNEP